jgi:hypothetical protein
VKAHELVSLLTEYADPNAEVEIDVASEIVANGRIVRAVGIDVWHSPWPDDRGVGRPAVWITDTAIKRDGPENAHHTFTPEDITVETQPWTPKMTRSSS